MCFNCRPNQKCDNMIIFKYQDKYKKKWQLVDGCDRMTSSAASPVTSGTTLVGGLRKLSPSIKRNLKNTHAENYPSRQFRAHPSPDKNNNKASSRLFSAWLATIYYSRCSSPLLPSALISALPWVSPSNYLTTLSPKASPSTIQTATLDWWKKELLPRCL
jgi:hypothetical protein